MSEQKGKEKVEVVKTVKMWRHQPVDQTRATTADVHPSEVEDYERNGWHQGDKPEAPEAA